MQWFRGTRAGCRRCHTPRRACLSSLFLVVAFRHALGITLEHYTEDVPVRSRPECFRSDSIVNASTGLLVKASVVSLASTVNFSMDVADKACGIAGKGKTFATSATCWFPHGDAMRVTWSFISDAVRAQQGDTATFITFQHHGFKSGKQMGKSICPLCGGACYPEEGEHAARKHFESRESGLMSVGSFASADCGVPLTVSFTSHALSMPIAPGRDSVELQVTLRNASRGFIAMLRFLTEPIDSCTKDGMSLIGDSLNLSSLLPLHAVQLDPVYKPPPSSVDQLSPPLTGFQVKFTLGALVEGGNLSLDVGSEACHSVSNGDKNGEYGGTCFVKYNDALNFSWMFQGVRVAEEGDTLSLDTFIASGLEAEGGTWNVARVRLGSATCALCGRQCDQQAPDMALTPGLFGASTGLQGQPCGHLLTVAVASPPLGFVPADPNTANASRLLESVIEGEWRVRRASGSVVAHVKYKLTRSSDPSDRHDLKPMHLHRGAAIVGSENESLGQAIRS